MKDNLKHDRTCVYNINYHLVWSVKYRSKVITDEIEDYMREVAEETAKKNGFEIHLFEAGDQDHIHCFVSAPPRLSVTNIVRYLKGVTARKVFLKYPHLKKSIWGGKLWNHSYYCETVGSVSEENIRRYIQDQKNRE